jgi:hypothetical protein
MPVYRRLVLKISPVRGSSGFGRRNRPQWVRVLVRLTTAPEQ